MMTKKQTIVMLLCLLLALGTIGSLVLLEHDCQKQSVKEERVIHKDEQEYSLPIVTVDMKQKENIKQTVDGVSANEVQAKIQIYDRDGHNYLSDKPTKTVHALMRIRGNSTRLVPKKQYRLTLMDKNFKKEIDKKMLGLSQNSHWILNGPFEDKSFMRNRLAYSVSRKIMEWAPRTRYCEVFIRKKGQNGKMDQYYKGIYLMMESIDRDDKRVNIEKSDHNSTETSFIIQNNRPRQGDRLVKSYGYENYLYDYPYMVVYPGRKNLTASQRQYIEQTMSLFERALYSENSKDDYRKYIDMDSFVDYYIINEFFKNTDAGMLSTYMYKDYGQKIKAGPVWDFNASMGNSDLLSPYFDYKGFYNNRTPLFDHLLQHREFADQVIERYRILRKTYLSDKYLMHQIDLNVAELGNAPKRNERVWPVWLCNQFEMFKEYQDVFLSMGDNVSQIKTFLDKNPRYKKSTENMATSFNDEVQKLRVFLKNRGKWLDDNIDELRDMTGVENEDNE